MTFEIECKCLRSFPVRDEFAGGIVNCPHCGKATQVPGLRDPFWRMLQVGAALLSVGASAVVFIEAGPVVGIVTGVMLAAVLWLISRCL